MALLFNIIVCKRSRSSRSRKHSKKNKLQEEEIYNEGQRLKEVIEESDQMINDMLTKADSAEEELDVNWELVFRKVKEARMAMEAIEIGDFSNRFDDLSTGELLELDARLEQLKKAAVIDLPSLLSGSGNNNGKP